MSASTCWAPTCWLARRQLAGLLDTDSRLATQRLQPRLATQTHNAESQHRITAWNHSAESQLGITAWNHSAVESQARTSCELARLLDEPPKYVAVRRLHSPSKHVAVPRLYSPSTFHRAPQPTPRAARRPTRRAARTAPGQAGRPASRGAASSRPATRAHKRDANSNTTRPHLPPLASRPHQNTRITAMTKTQESPL